MLLGLGWGAENNHFYICDFLKNHLYIQKLLPVPTQLFVITFRHIKLHETRVVIFLSFPLVAHHIGNQTEKWRLINQPAFRTYSFCALHHEKTAQVARQM